MSDTPTELARQSAFSVTCFGAFFGGGGNNKMCMRTCKRSWLMSLEWTALAAAFILHDIELQIITKTKICITVSRSTGF